MRIPLLCTLLVAACAGAEKAPEVPEGPVALTAADFTGTWSGETKAGGTDSVIATWTITSADGVQGTLTSTTAAEPVAYTTVFDADSLIATSGAYSDPVFGADPIMWVSVGRLESAGVMVGTVKIMLAANPDSVLANSTWRSTKNP